jgi:translation elongation factor EF-4
LLFDSWYDKYVGVVCMLGVKDGVLLKGKSWLLVSCVYTNSFIQGDKVVSAYSGTKYEITEVSRALFL